MVITQNGSNNVIANLEKLKDSNITLTINGNDNVISIATSNLQPLILTLVEMDTV